MTSAKFKFLRNPGTKDFPGLHAVEGDVAVVDGQMADKLLAHPWLAELIEEPKPATAELEAEPEQPKPAKPQKRG